MSAEIINLFSRATRPTSTAAPTSSSPRLRVKRNRNSPYRRLWGQTEMGFVELNKIDHPYSEQQIERIRRGVESARALADIMAKEAEKLIGKPPRRTNSEAIGRRREFNQAMRQRIRDIAASRGLSEDDIRPAMKLKHEAIGAFCLTYKVRAEWLLEGRGPIWMTREEMVVHDLADK